MASNTANLPETLKICTSDNEVIEVTGKLINESLVIKELFGKNGNHNANEMTVQVKSAELRIAVKVLELCDLEKPYVTMTSYMERYTFEDEHKQVLDYVKSLSAEDITALINFSNNLEMARLLDLCIVTLIRLTEGVNVHELRENLGLRDDYTEEEEAAFRNKHTV